MNILVKFVSLENPDPEYDGQSIRIPVACMVALTCFEIFGLITGISIFNVRVFVSVTF